MTNAKEGASQETSVPVKAYLNISLTPKWDTELKVRQGLVKSVCCFWRVFFSITSKKLFCLAPLLSARD